MPTRCHAGGRRSFGRELPGGERAGGRKLARRVGHLPIKPQNLNRSLDVLSARGGISRVRFNDLRTTCASLLHEQGADARTIMEVLGHSSIRVTMDIHTFVRLDAQRDAIGRGGAALRGDANGRSNRDGDDGTAGALAAV
ncbi:tyrosine-type recombinase/integrase [Streptomyces profundus]|uniref:tyrosine-type recombinase/integrase n=1 Tax=Streptomyces profundus TaxID=2867410 RepID=UPI001D16DD7A|nr:tyrosine-type recombinase/integrase [Streptomyces sp. MA3_2.13]UED85201.1 tyrosine-type recombinase/integrase [Streptomyces sp. MA3_2.13]